MTKDHSGKEDFVPPNPNPETKSNPTPIICSSCQSTYDKCVAVEKLVDHELWRAGKVIERARAIRACATFVLYATAIFHIVFSDVMWTRAGALLLILICFKAMHEEG